MSAPQMSPELRKLTDQLRTAEFEKTIPYMYVDPVGKVTVGVGHNLTDNPDPRLTSLSFVVARLERHNVRGGDKGVSITDNPVIGRPATATEIQNDYDFLRRHQPLGRYSPDNMAKYTTLELTASSINALFESDRNYFFFRCRQEFGSDTFLSFPVTCQAALIDIAFNCGSFAKFRTHFVPAIKAMGQYAGRSQSDRWLIAAEHCYRPAVSATRNNIVKQWLIEGAQAGAARKIAS